MSARAELPMRYLFVGGPGRSGTSFVADRLGGHPQIMTFKDIELKIFCEKNGLLDLFHALCETYSPNRGVMALDQFLRMAEALIAGRYGQPPLSAVASSADWRACFDSFAGQLRQDGHPVPQAPGQFLDAARTLLRRIAALAAGAGLGEPAPGSGEAAQSEPATDPVPDPSPDRVFLEKTPHNLLAIEFLARLAPGARFLHVMRDPRSIAWSLLAMRWGPDELTTATRWVDSYCRAWALAEARAAALGLALIRLHIEEAAAEPEAAAAWLTGQLGLAPHPGLLRGADPVVLNRWMARADPAQRALLDARLSGWVAHFGYDPQRIGWRPCPALPLLRSEAPAPEAPPPAIAASVPDTAPQPA